MKRTCNQVDTEEYNSLIFDIWQSGKINIAHPIQQLPPLPLLGNKRKDSVAILGMNPSYTKEDAVNSLDCSPNDASIEKLLVAQKRNHEEYRYFKQINKFFDEIGILSERLWFADLFPIRHTNQTEVTDFLAENMELKRKLEDLFIDVLLSSNVSMCVVLNAKASDYIRLALSEYLQPKPILSEPRSHYSLGKDSLNRIPIIFAGMITGAGQMDKYSKLRLKSEIIDLDKLATTI